LLAAGFAPAYSETDLASPQAEQARWALQLLLRQHEPFAAVVFDREWNMLMANAGWLRFAAVVGQPLEAEPYTVLQTPRPNLLRAIFEDGPLHRSIENFDLVAATLLARLEREADSALVREILDRPDLAALRATADPRDAQAMIVPVDLRLGDLRALLHHRHAGHRAGRDAAGAACRGVPPRRSGDGKAGALAGDLKLSAKNRFVLARRGSKIGPWNRTAGPAPISS
jgi:hypothetical protein